MYKNYIFNRPVTPHLTIYFPQLSSLLSIWHRLAGIILVFLLFSIFFFLELEFSLELNSFSLVSFSYWLIMFFYLVVSVVFSYHSLNGCRHLFWDLLLLLKHSSLQTSSIIILIFLLLITLKTLTTL
uniref:succinate dehydrogenase subunit 3 n=1 Tax=Fushitsunagia catenata TaxID=1827018 RepID=UPI0026E139C0|nr:succinate dehydrogenase subunit 3 [Fushitsunagia catenata]WJJ67925.1 succinate dehydrogenase subunit 3 [Fushitsunagia catenata]